jgi:Reverse transcriptase (RNA-dependent DNA polymerase)
MKFNDHISEPFHPSDGTPQGSPLSLILLAIVTSPLLQHSLDFTDTDVTLYVDDGCIYASGPTYNVAAAKVTDAFTWILSLLRRIGLEVDNDKMELMFFVPPRPSSHHGVLPQTVTIPYGNGKTLTVKPSTSLRYLGVFFTSKLDWRLHVTTMANCVRSTVKALGVLGSSVQGISLLSWHRLFHSLLLPTLTYGCGVWFTDIGQKSLIQILTIAQNEACRKLAGVFHTTPCSLTELLVGIPPIRYRLHHLLCNQGKRVSNLPITHHLHCLPQTSWLITLPLRHAVSPPLLPDVAEMNPPPLHITLHATHPLWIGVISV